MNSDKWNKWIQDRKQCDNCWHCNWCHDGPKGQCLGYNDVENTRTGCDIKCSEFIPMPDNLPEAQFIFKPSPIELHKANKWFAKHQCSVRGQYRGAIGGGDQWIFSPNGIGCVVHVKCLCGEEADVSDYEW